FRHPALVRTSNTHAHQAVVEIGVDLQCLFKMHRGVIESVNSAKSDPQIVFYADIRWSDRERVLKQSEAVTPALNLRIRKSSENQKNRSGYSCAERWRNAPTRDDLR